MVDPVVSGAMVDWLVPLVVIVLVLVVAWFGIRWAESEHLEAIQSVPLFSGLSQSHLRSVLRSARREEFHAGTAIVRQGESGRGCFVLTEGKARVEVDGEEVAGLAAGGYFGEMAALDEAPRSATVVAISEVSALEFPRAAVLRLIQHNPDAAKAMAQELSARLGKMGVPVDAPADPVTTDDLVQLTRRLRSAEHRDWSPTESTRRHRLSLTSLFARG